MRPPMRRANCALGEYEALELLKNAPYAVLSTAGSDGEPYGVALNVAFQEDGRTAYFHCALEGHKLDNIAQNARVSLLAVDGCQIVHQELTTRYSSACAFGRAVVVTDRDEAARALRLLGRRFTPDHMDLIEMCIEKSGGGTCVVRVDIERITGKAR